MTKQEHDASVTMNVDDIIFFVENVKIWTQVHQNEMETTAFQRPTYPLRHGSWINLFDGIGESTGPLLA